MNLTYWILLCKLGGFALTNTITNKGKKSSAPEEVPLESILYTTLLQFLIQINLSLGALYLLIFLNSKKIKIQSNDKKYKKSIVFTWTS